MYKFYTANNTNDYGSGIHKCIIIANTNFITKTELDNEYDIVIFTDANDDGIPDNYAIDNGSVRIKTEYEQVQDRIPVKIKEISEWYDIARSSGYETYLGITLDCGADDIANWTSALSILSLSGATQIRIGDYYNQTHILSKEDFQNACLELGQYVQWMFDRKWDLRNQALAATTHAELDVLQWYI